MEVQMITRDLRQMIGDNEENLIRAAKAIETQMRALGRYKGADRAEAAIQMYEMGHQRRQRHLQETMVRAGIDSPPCRKGCSYCCHQYIAATPDEVELICKKIKEKKIQINMKHLKYQAKFKDSDSMWEKYSERTGCVLLDKDGSCRIYNDRPLACRVLLSGEASSDPCAPGSGDTKVGTVRYLADPSGVLIINALLNLYINESKVELRNCKQGFLIPSMQQMMLKML